MNIEEQVLSLEQIKELQELGFDFRKYSSACVIEAKDRNKYIVDRKLIGLHIGFMETEVIEYYETMTIGDIADILPIEIDEYVLDMNRIYVSYDSKRNNLFYAYKDKFIDNLFDTLVWCIKQKHIEIIVHLKTEKKSLEEYKTDRENIINETITEINTIISPEENISLLKLKADLRNFLSERLSSQKLSFRLLNSFEKVNMNYPKYVSHELNLVGDIFLFRRDKILKFRNIGKKSINELDKWIDDINNKYQTNLMLGMTEEQLRELIE